MAEKAREEERKAIREKIDGFYAPFLQLRGTSALLYRKAFALRRTKDEVDKYSDADGHFKTFIALVRGHKFTGADELLLEQIIDIGQSTAKLIYDKIGLVTDPGIQETLARATAHYRLIQIAFLNPERFQGAGAEFELFTFPADLDQMVRETLSGLNARLQTLTTTSALSQPRRRERA